MSVPSDIGLFLSGGSSNKNPFLSTGGSISSTKIIQKGWNNLWADVSDRQRRYGYKDLRIIYCKNLTTTTTFKNARVFWRVSDDYTSLQIGRGAINDVETSSLSVAALLPNDLEIPPKQWATAAQVITQWRTIQDWNSLSESKAQNFGNGRNNNKLGVHISDSGAALNNQKIHRWSCVCRRTGAAHGNVICKIWDEGGNEKVTIGSIPASSLSDQPSTGTGTQNIITFTNQNNNYQCHVGDIIGLEYPDGDENDYLTWSYFNWSGDTPDHPPTNEVYDIKGTDEYVYSNNTWSNPSGIGSNSELKYKAETYEVIDCTPNPPEQTSEYITLVDYSDPNPTTAYAIGNGAPNNIFRRAVRIDDSRAKILQAPIARFSLFARRVGNPQGNFACRIWSANGTVMTTLGTMSVTSITNLQNTWSEIQFTDENNAYKMKITDLIGIEFTSGTQEDYIALGGFSWQGAASAAAEGESGQSAATSDNKGVRMIYQNDGNFRYDWDIPSDSSSMRWDLTNPPLNCEMTAYFQKSSPSSDTISCKIRGGRHTDSAQNDGCCYIPQFPTTGGSMDFQIECPHPNNHDCSVSGINGNSTSLSTWHGYKVAWWNQGNCVHIEAWNDTGDASGSTPPNNWVKVQEHNDCSGNCGNIDAPLFKPKGNTSQCTFRIDNNSGTTGKWLSAVSISGSVVDFPPSGAKDYPGTSIARWNGSTWATDDGGQSDLVYKAEAFEIGDQEIPDVIIIDPGNKRKPTTYDQGIVLPPLGPGDWKGIIMERLFLPSTETGIREIEQSLVIECDTTTEASQPTDPGNPPPGGTTPPPISPSPTQPPLQCPSGQYYDAIQGVCVQMPGSPGTTQDGITLPSLPTTSYSYDPIDYTADHDYNSNGSYREDFERNGRDMNSVIIGGYILCDGPSDEEITAILGGGQHSSSDGGKAGRSYIVALRFDGTKIRIRKEDPHPDFHETGINKSISLGDRRDHYTGFIAMKVNIIQNGKEVVKIMCWVDTAGMSDGGTFTAGNQNWQLILDETDTGNWYNKPWLTCAVSGNSQTTLRTDEQTGSSYDSKLIFCARIKGGPAY